MSKKIKIGIQNEWTKDKMRNLLIENDLAVVRGLVELYKRQLPEERNYMVSTTHNKVGFNRVDAPFLTLKASQAVVQGGLSKKDIYVIRPTLIKYSGQLADIANKQNDKQMEWKI